MFKNPKDGVPGWLSRLSIQLLVSPQVVISGSWDGAQHRTPCLALTVCVLVCVCVRACALSLTLALR